jgi:hypothetical protein
MWPLNARSRKLRSSTLKVTENAQTVEVLPSGAGLALLAPARDEADLGTALSCHIGRLFCRAAAPTRRESASQKESLGTRAEFRRLSMPTIAGANFRVGRQPTGAATSVNT